MIKAHQIEAAKQTIALMVSVGCVGRRLNSKALVRFANRHGLGETFVFGDRVFMTVTDGETIVIKAPA